ncbi:MAG TPA: pyridoxamine 5'-phosphate oxidase [Anaerolineales bacterium]|nr:pyridoxamine 5'-phosphate oxidase [Anaerolineales bacterium]
MSLPKINRKKTVLSAIAARRKEYMRAGLSRADLHPDPFVQFERWFADALDSDMIEPTAMQLATALPDGQPDVRTVLLRTFDSNGFVFYTNYTSAKGRQIAQNPQVALLFVWDVLERQVRIHGTAHKLSPEQSAAYFQSRPHDAQLAALASQQSQPLSSRAELLARWQAWQTHFPPGVQIPAPNFWGGYCVVPARFEFWQGGLHRLHDRFSYQLTTPDAWSITRLNP